ncbi:MAG: hypothetical protein K2X93_12750 [Candidatus Obscuribacterales bacterium]|nr:hypothetical protein [Candidatus Obscuribacterales bacterium]
MLILLIVLAEIGILFAAYWLAFVKEPRPQKVKPSTWGNYKHAAHDCHMYLIRSKYGVQRAAVDERKHRKPHHNCKLEVEQHTYGLEDNQVLLPAGFPDLMPKACPELLPTYEGRTNRLPSNVVPLNPNRDPNPDDSDQPNEQKSA